MYFYFRFLVGLIYKVNMKQREKLKIRAGNSSRADEKKEADLLCAIWERHTWGTLEHVKMKHY